MTGASLLSTRQVQLLRLVQQGLSNREIATRLEMTPGSVNTSLWRINRALGVSGRTAAIFAAVRDGLIEPVCPQCREREATIRAQATQIRQMNAAMELLEAVTLDDMKHEGALT
jgi:DNA-binding CsgD family transcriptional regulator